MIKYFRLILVVVFIGTTCFAANPKLFFDSSDIQVLRQKRYEPHIQPIWQAILQKANNYSTASSPEYVDPSSSWFTEGDYGWYGRDVMGWVETLGFVYLLTGNPVYGNHGAAILAASADYIAPPGSLMSMNIDMMRTFATGYDWLSGAMTAQQKAKIEARAKDYIEWSFSDMWGRPYHNFMGVGFGGTGLLALAMEDVYPEQSPAWINQARDFVEEWFYMGFDEKGAYVEGHDYMYYGFSNALAFADALKRNKQINILNHPHISNVEHFLAMIRLPGTDMYEGRNDARYSTGMNVSILALMRETDSAFLRWLWDRSELYWTSDYHVGGYSPFRLIWDNDIVPLNINEANLPLAEHFPQRGLITFRSGWELDDSLFTIEAGPYYCVTHNQADKGHFGFYRFGKIWAADTIYGNNRDPEGRCQTIAHNCVLINGEGQALSGASRGTDGEILAYEDHKYYGYALADATSAYNISYHGDLGVGAEFALRHSVYVRPSGGKPAYAVVFDDIKKDDSEHLYSWQLLSWEDMDIKADGDNPVVIPIEYVKTPEGTTGTGEAIWSVDVPETGDYQIWAKVRADGVSISGSDSFKVQVDEGTVIQWPFVQDSNRPWRWQKVAVEGTALSFNLTAGTHEIKFLTRETGAQLSAVFLTKDTTADQPFTYLSTNGIFLAAAQAQLTAPMQFYSGDTAMQVIVDASAPVSYSLDVYQPNDGRWPESFPQLRANCTAVNPKFISFMMPHSNQEVLPDVTFTDIQGGRKINVAWEDRNDEIAWVGNDIIVNLEASDCSYKIPGDINNDCYVDIADFAILADSWMMCSMPDQPSCEIPQ